MKYVSTIAILLLAGCAGTAEPSDIAVASYPSLFLAETLAGDDLTVAFIGNNGGLHGFEPSVRDIATLKETSHLVIWDESLETWVHQAEESLGNNAPPMLELFALHGDEEPVGYEEEEEHGDHDGHEDHDEHDDGHGDHGHGHDHGDYDPHSWNDPLSMKESALVLSVYLQASYPEFASGIQERTDALIDALDELHEAFQTKLDDCSRNVIVTNHEAYSYLARRYQFDVIALHGLAPGSEPTHGAIEEAIEAIKEHNIPVIYVEEGTDGTALDAIQSETNVLVHVLHTNEIQPRTGDYLSSQLQNTEKLQFALGCT